MEYTVTIGEYISQDFQVKAETPEEAFRKAEKLYKDGVYVLDDCGLAYKEMQVRDVDYHVLIDFQEF